MQMPERRARVGMSAARGGPLRSLRIVTEPAAAQHRAASMDLDQGGNTISVNTDNLYPYDRPWNTEWSTGSGPAYYSPQLCQSCLSRRHYVYKSPCYSQPRRGQKAARVGVQLIVSSQTKEAVCLRSADVTNDHSSCLTITARAALGSTRAQLSQIGGRQGSARGPALTDGMGWDGIPARIRGVWKRKRTCICQHQRTWDSGLAQMRVRSIPGSWRGRSPVSGLDPPPTLPSRAGLLRTPYKYLTLGKRF